MSHELQDSQLRSYRSDWPSGRWPNFSYTEMRCRETGACLLVPAFMDRLQRLRRLYGRPMIITSGYRSPEHSLERIKALPGAHPRGRAADVLCDGVAAHALLRAALGLGFTGIGVAQAGEERFVHLDDLSDDEFHMPRPDVWSY